MDEKYNGLTKAILLFQKEHGCKLVPVANLQPGYGPWETMDAAREGLIEIFEDIGNVPSEYTFCVLNNPDNKPKEWWFTEKGVWETVAPKCIGDSLEAILMFRIHNDMLQVSYDGGETWTDITMISPMTENYITDVELLPDGTLRVSYDNQNTWFQVGKIMFEITSSGYLRYSFDGGNTWASIKIIAADALSGGSTPGGGNTGGGPLDNVTSENVDDVEFQNPNDSSASTYSGQDACDVIVYIATDYPNQLSTLMESMYPNVSVGSYVIIRSTLYDRTGGKSNASDETHTYELDHSWTTQDVLNNSKVADWYHYFKITKVDVNKWVGVAWIGRTAEYIDTVRHTVTIGTITPQEASVTVTYNGVTYENLHTGSTITVDDDATIIITATAEGYENYSQTIEHITADQTVNVAMSVVRDTVKVTFLSKSADPGRFGVTLDRFNYCEYYSSGRIYEFDKGLNVQVFYFVSDSEDDYDSKCFNVQAINHVSGESVYLKKGSDEGTAYVGWKYYTINEDTTFRALTQHKDDPEPPDPEEPVPFTFDFNTVHIGDHGKIDYFPILDSSARIEVTYNHNGVEHTESNVRRQLIITGHIGDTIRGTARVVGGSTQYREITFNNEIIGTNDIISYDFIPDGYSFVVFDATRWNPQDLSIDFTPGTEETETIMGSSDLVRLFRNGTLLRFRAYKQYYSEVSWEETLTGDYSTPTIRLNFIGE